MKTLKIIIATLAVVILLVAAALFCLGRYKPTTAGLKIETIPASVVFIDNEQVGRTPYEGKLKAQEVNIKLVPEPSDKPLVPYETKVSLTSGIETYVQRSFGDLESASSGRLVSFEKIGANQASLSVVSSPDATQVILDGQVVGYTPLKVSSISPVEHQLQILAEGFFEESFPIRPREGYGLTVVVKLKLNQEYLEPEEQSKVEEKQKTEPGVKILTTPTGFLRVRRQPSTLSEEIAQVKPEEEFKLLETDEKSGWFKIEYEENKEGWVSNRYAQEIELIP